MVGQNLYKKNNNRFKTILLSCYRRPEKMFLVFFVVSLFALGVGIFYTKNTITRPFSIFPDDQITETDNSEALNNFSNLLAEQQKDTDGDSLTDYQEINIYKTSIYLVDSDSDGIDDNVEISKGTNPNCPEGQDCSFVDTPNVDVGDIIPTVDDFLSPDYISSASVILLQNGYTEIDLANMSDEEIAGAYDMLLESPDSSLNKQQEFASGDIDLQVLRELLLENGIPAEDLQKISDEELLILYNEIITQEEN